ncbi:MAG: hypothetical protein AAF358_01315 [Pseudomonadota bacterium]
MQKVKVFGLILALALLSGCAATQPAADGESASREPVARNTRTYCRSDVERTGQNDIASAVNRSASAGSSRC